MGACRAPAGYPDRIILETGYSTAQAIAKVATGRADMVWDGVRASDVDPLRTRYGSQLHTDPDVFTQYLFLNATKPPFANPDARRALAYALDRTAGRHRHRNSSPHRPRAS